MKVETNKLTGPALDWAVAKCEAWIVGTTDDDLVSFVLEDSIDEMHYWPSTDWSQGGPIIEREKICADYLLDGRWLAVSRTTEKQGLGPTPLIAAMRCYCCAKLGEYVDIPEELCQQPNS